MPQVKIFGLAGKLAKRRTHLSDVIHAAAVEVLQAPPEQRFHRFLALAPDDFIFPSDRSDDYTIIEVALFAGRSVQVKKQFIRLLYSSIDRCLGIRPQDVEIALFELPAENWGILGKSGNEFV